MQGRQAPALRKKPRSHSYGQLSAKAGTPGPRKVANRVRVVHGVQKESAVAVQLRRYWPAAQASVEHGWQLLPDRKKPARQAQSQLSTPGLRPAERYTLVSFHSPTCRVGASGPQVVLLLEEFLDLLGS